MSEETQVKAVEDENPSAAEKETKALKKMGANIGEETITKVDLRQPKEEASAEDSIKKEEPVKEELKSEEPKPEESAKEEPIIEEVKEDSKPPQDIPKMKEEPVIKSINDTKHVNHGAIRGDGVSTFNSNTSVVNKDILNRLQGQCNEYARKYGAKDNLKLDNIWSNIQNSNSVLDEHCHPQSIISGSLYLNVDDSF